MDQPTLPDCTAPTPRIRHDGWTVARQVGFVRGLRAGLSVTRAAAVVGMRREGAYRLRDRPGNDAFAAAWDAALAAARRAPLPQPERHNLLNERHGRAAPDRACPPRERHESHAAPESRRTVNRVNRAPARHVPARHVPAPPPLSLNRALLHPSIVDESMTGECA